MAWTGASLADGQVATSVGTIYGPSGVKAIVKYCSFFNTNAAVQTLNVYITRSGGTRRQILRATMNQYDAVYLVSQGESLQLSDGDVLEADTTTTTAVDYMITGASE